MPPSREQWQGSPTKNARIQVVTGIRQGGVSQDIISRHMFRQIVATSANVIPNGLVRESFPQFARKIQVWEVFAEGKWSSSQVMAIHKKCGSVLCGIHLEATGAL